MREGDEIGVSETLILGLYFRQVEPQLRLDDALLCNPVPTACS